ncbi:MAG: hypothetical protein J7480_07265 [Microbacteriaceae bacterium]|nr:hypothetical protein [Microbacteriaceae bacterium]
MKTPAALRSAAALLSAVLLAGCAAQSAPAPSESDPVASAPAGADCGDAGVRVVVEFTVLEDAQDVDACVLADAPTSATEVLAAAGVGTEGTLKWGDASICRIDGRPSQEETVRVDGFPPIHEDCDDFTPGAYWAVWVLPAGGEWAYAPVGVNELELQPGEALGLVFTTGDGTVSLPPTAG